MDIAWSLSCDNFDEIQSKRPTSRMNEFSNRDNTIHQLRMTGRRKWK
jgi:hypothetical protein